MEEKFENYYKLKQKYEKYIKNKLDSIRKDDDLSNSDKQKKISKVLANIKVKKIFSNKGRKLSIVENEKKVISYDNDYYNLYETAAKNFKKWDKENKEEIMRLKLDVLFNYIDEENSMNEFELLKREIKEDLTEYSKIVAEIYAIEHVNKNTMQNEEDKLFENINLFKEKLATNEEGYLQEAMEIYKSLIMPTTRELHRLKYDKGYCEVMEEEQENGDPVYHLITESISILSREFSNEANEEDLMDKVSSNQEVEDIIEKRKLKETELDSEHERVAILTEELGELMVEYSKLTREKLDTSAIQQEIDFKTEQLNKQRDLVDSKQLKTRNKSIKSGLQIPENLGYYERQKYINALSPNKRKEYIDSLSPEELDMYVENLKQRGPNRLEKNYDKEKETMSEGAFKTFLIKDLMKTQNISNAEAKEIVFFLKAFEDYYKYDYAYELFPNADEDVQAVDMKKKIEKSILDRKTREKSREDALFTRNGELPPWGDATLYPEKLVIGTEVYLAKPRVFFYTYAKEIMDSDAKVVDDYIDHPFQVREVKTWTEDEMEKHNVGGEKDQAHVHSKNDANLHGWVNLKDIYVDVNPSNDEDSLNAEVVLSTPADKEQSEAVTLDDLPELTDISGQIKAIDLNVTGEEEKKSPNYQEWLEENGYSPLKDLIIDD